MIVLSLNGHLFARDTIPCCLWQIAVHVSGPCLGVILYTSPVHLVLGYHTLLTPEIPFLCHMCRGSSCGSGPGNSKEPFRFFCQAPLCAPYALPSSSFEDNTTFTSWTVIPNSEFLGFS